MPANPCSVKFPAKPVRTQLHEQYINHILIILYGFCFCSTGSSEIYRVEIFVHVVHLSVVHGSFKSLSAACFWFVGFVQWLCKMGKPIKVKNHYDGKVYGSKKKKGDKKDKTPKEALRKIPFKPKTGLIPMFSTMFLGLFLISLGYVHHKL